MNTYAMLAIAQQIEKFSELSNSRRILKPHVQTLFDAADKVTPAFKAACSRMDIMKKAMPAGGVIC